MMNTARPILHHDSPRQREQRCRLSSEAGTLLVEMVIAIAMLLSGAMATAAIVASCMQAYNSTRATDTAVFALEDVSEQLKDADFPSFWATFDGGGFEVENLPNVGGSPAIIGVECYVDETDIPAEFGPILDLDGDPNTDATNCSGSYEMLPVKLTLTYELSPGVSATREIYMVLSED